MPGGPIIIIDPNKPRTAPEQAQVDAEGFAVLRSVYDEARGVIDAAEAAGEEVKILGAG